MTRKLGRIQRKAVETFLTLMKKLPYDQVPPQVISELAKYGIIKEENETMDQFSDKILLYLKSVEQTL